MIGLPSPLPSPALPKRTTRLGLTFVGVLAKAWAAARELAVAGRKKATGPKRRARRPAQRGETTPSGRLQARQMANLRPRGSGWRLARGKAYAPSQHQVAIGCLLGGFPGATGGLLGGYPSAFLLSFGCYQISL